MRLRPIEIGGRRYVLIARHVRTDHANRRVTYNLRLLWVRRRDRALGFLLALYALAKAVR